MGIGRQRLHSLEALGIHLFLQELFNRVNFGSLSETGSASGLIPVSVGPDVQSFVCWGPEEVGWESAVGYFDVAVFVGG